MHKILSFLSPYFLSPVNWILLLLALAFLFRKRRSSNYFNIAALGVFLVFSSPVLMNWFARKWQTPRSEIPANTVYSCGIVLGGFASMDADRYPYFNGAADRFIQILRLYKTGRVQHILVSGGNGRVEKNGFAEAAWVKQELIVMGVPDSVILTEDRSVNTAENAANSKLLLQSFKLKPPYLLVTSASHMPRAALLFKRAGISTLPFACNYSTTRLFDAGMLLPSINTLTAWNGYIKEAVSYLAYK